MKKKENKVVSVSWSHKQDEQAYFDGKDILSSVTLKKGNILLATNLPTYQAKEYFKNGVKIFTSHVMSLNEHRYLMGYKKLKHYDAKKESHKIDAIVIYDLYQLKPALFYEWKPNEMNLLYKNYKQIQEARISASNRLWAFGGKDAENKTVESLKIAEEESVKAMERVGESDIVYQYARGIQQVGPRTAGALVGLIDATKFPTASKLRKYAGLSVIDNKIQRLRKGETGGYSTELKGLLLGLIANGFIKSSGTNHPTEYFIDYIKVKESIQKRPPIKISLENEEKIVGDILAENIGPFEKGEVIYKHIFLKLKKECKKEKKKSVLVHLSPGHIHNQALRKMMILFLEDYWVISRQLQGFSTVPPYALTIKGHSHYRKPRYIPKILQPFNPLRDDGWIFIEGKRPWNEAPEYIKNKCGKL